MSLPPDDGLYEEQAVIGSLRGPKALPTLEERVVERQRSRRTVRAVLRHVLRRVDRELLALADLEMDPEGLDRVDPVVELVGTGTVHVQIRSHLHDLGLTVPGVSRQVADLDQLELHRHGPLSADADTDDLPVGGR